MINIIFKKLICVLFIMSTFSYAESYPNKPIKVVVPFSAGGQGDVMARIITKKIQESGLISQPIVVVNMGGGGATVGARYVNKAKPDGYTLLYLHQTLMTLDLTGKLNFQYTNFEPIAETSHTCLVSATAKKSGINNANEFIIRAKESPKKSKVALLIGSTGHFAMAMLGNSANIDFGIVNVAGGAERVASLLGNHTESAILAPSELTRNPDLKGLIYYGEQRNTQIPDVPTARELGFDVVSCLNNVWWAPKGTPEAIISKLENVFAKVLTDPDLIKEISDKGDNPYFLSGNELKQKLNERYERLKKALDYI